MSSSFAWAGVFPAVTTKFRPDGSLDRQAQEAHLEFLLRAGVHGLVMLGSLGENGTLSGEEKLQVLESAVRTAAGKVPVLAGVAETTTAGACRFAEKAAHVGADGFMALPPMLYQSDPRETVAHIRAVASATDKPIMIYNNPVAYRVDITPEMFAELADEPACIALKESSDNPRRITDIVNLTGDRYRIFVGVDDLALESLLLGAVGWVAGLVCAFPAECLALYRLVSEGKLPEARAIYRWFMPLLHLDASVRFVHYIKLAEQIAGVGTEYMRPPRLPLEGEERRRVEKIIRDAMATRKNLFMNLRI
jgi:4-hydroxy-tetrahydrodipicolinate synthase